MSKENLEREASKREREFHRIIKEFHLESKADQVSMECLVTDYMQRQIELCNKHSKNLQFWLEMVETSDVGIRLDNRVANYLQEQLDYWNGFLKSFQLKLGLEGQSESRLPKFQVAA